MTAKIQQTGLVERLQGALPRSAEPRTSGSTRGAEGSDAPGAAPAAGASDVVTLSPLAVRGAAPEHGGAEQGGGGAGGEAAASAAPPLPALDAEGVRGALGAIRALAGAAPAAMVASHGAADPSRLVALLAGG